MMGKARSVIQSSGVVVAALMAVSVGLSTPTSAAPGGSEGKAPPAASTEMRAPALPEVSAARTSVDPAGYWTPEKMASAESADEVADDGVGQQPAVQSKSTPKDKPGTASTPVAATQPQDGLQAQATPVPTTVGKLFFVNAAGRDSVCTAATINSGDKDLIETAGHCVYTAQVGWHSNILFAPAYFNGVSHLGTYSWRTARTFNAWINDGNYNYDQAFVELNPRNGVRVVDAVGGNGLNYNYPTNQPNVRIWGYPAEGNYNGELPYYCDGPTTDRSIWNSDAQMVCDMTGGASGGPWLNSRISADLGYVFAVTSRRTTSGTPYLLAVPHTTDTKTMYDLMG